MEEWCADLHETAGFTTSTEDKSSRRTIVSLKPQQGLVPHGRPRMPVQPNAAYHHAHFHAYPPPYPPAPQQVRQPSSAPGGFMQNNAMGGIYSCSPYEYQYPGAVMSHNVDVSISNHPGEGISQLSSVSAYTGMNQPHTGYAFSNNGMNMPNSVPTWGSTQPMRIPTTQGPSTAGVPGFNFGPAANQHWTFQRDNFRYGILQQETVQQGPSQHGLVMQGPIQHAPVQHGTVPHNTAQYGNVQRGPVQHGNIQHGTERHMLNPHGLNQPAPGSQGPSVNPAASNSVPAPGNHGIETITDSDDLLGTVDPRDLQLIPEDDYGLSLSQWLVVPPQQSQAVNQVSNIETRKFRGRDVDSHEQQYPDPAVQHEAHMRATQQEFPSITSHVLSPNTAPAIQEESRRHPDL